MNNIKGIWITWESQRRNRELSGALGFAIYELDFIDRIENRIWKYLEGIIRTVSIYLRERPDIVICQNPSLILSIFTVILKPILRYRVIVDAHNAGLFPNEGKSRILTFLSHQIQRHADLTIVSNKMLLTHVLKNGGRGFVLPDKIPDLVRTTEKTLNGKENILFICSYGNDEPYQIVFDAARKLDQEIFIYATGDYRKKGIEPASMPKNLVLTGFLAECEYVELLNSVNVTIDLTTRENCLVCGAYESVAAGKPMILSKTSALMNYFSLAAVYVEHTAEDLERGIHEALGNKTKLSERVRALKIVREQEWSKKKQELVSLIQGWFEI